MDSRVATTIDCAKEYGTRELDHEWAADIAQALALALAVVDACIQDEGTWCVLCEDWGHSTPDCPVLACVEKGLTRG